MSNTQTHRKEDLERKWRKRGKCRICSKCEKIKNFLVSLSLTQVWPYKHFVCALLRLLVFPHYLSICANIALIIILLYRLHSVFVCVRFVVTLVIWCLLYFIYPEMKLILCIFSSFVMLSFACLFFVFFPLSLYNTSLMYQVKHSQNKILWQINDCNVVVLYKERITSSSYFSYSKYSFAIFSNRCFLI